MKPSAPAPPVFRSAPRGVARTPHPEPSVRREVRPGDIGAIAALHGVLYSREYGLDSDFEQKVFTTLNDAAQRGWPGPREGAWLVDLGGRLAGSVGLTDEGAGEARIRWVLLDPALRGRGLGRRLIGEAVEEARAHGYRRITLDTFSELTQAARLYREHGFRVISEERGPRWGRTEINYQHYALEL